MVGWKSPLTLVVAVAAVGIVLLTLRERLPLQDWLIGDYGRIGGWQALFCVGCVSTGQVLLAHVLRLSFPMVEHWVMSMALGVVVFVLAMYLAGAFALYSSLFAVALPLLMTAIGAPTTLKALRGARAQWRALPSRPSWAGRVAVAFGLAALTLLYLQTATPDSISYDAAWSHLTIAESYAREGRIVSFPASTPKNLPHLSSILYTWAFLVPGFSHPALHWMMAQHTELLLFLWTLVGVSATVGWVLGGERSRGAWAAFFLFPGFFVYDSNLGAGSDHVAAFFALPLLLAAVRASQGLSPRLGVLAGLFAGAALHTKYQCAYLVGPIVVLFTIRVFTPGFLWRRLKQSLGGATGEQGARLGTVLSGHAVPATAMLAAFGCATLLSFGPHLLKNWLFYRNPVYPLLLDTFRGSAPLLSDWPYDPMAQATAKGDFLTQLVSALRLMFTFAFEPQYTFGAGLPSFGFLFSLMIPIALIHAKNRRMLTALLLAQGSVFLWALVYRVDRNLQLLLPWLVVVTASATILSWRTGRLARVGVSLLLLTQVAWGTPFLVGGGGERIKSFMDHVKRSLSRAEGDPYDSFRRPYRELGEALPKDAVVLLHTAHLHLGIDRTVLQDWAGWQYLIDYRAMRTPRDVFERYRRVGVTHMVWNRYDFPSSKQEDVLFFLFTRRYAVAVPAPRNFLLWAMPSEPPPEREPVRVLALGLHGYGDGLYAIDKMGVIEDVSPECQPYPAPDLALTKEADLAVLLQQADAVLVARGRTLERPAMMRLSRCFTREHDYYAGYGVAGYSVHLRRQNGSLCPESMG